jgi:hypothetical protein
VASTAQVPATVIPRGLTTGRGAGHGSFARWLSTQVGAVGSVTAADLDTRLLAGITEPNIEVRQTDLVSDPLPAGEFDFFHTQQAGVEAIPLPFHFGKPAGLGCLPPAPREQPWRRWHPLGCSPSGQAYTA